MQAIERNCLKRSGITLIEVIASIVLISSLLVGVLLTHSRNMQQLRRANQKIIAAEHVDDLLRTWFESPDPFPMNGFGLFQTKIGEMTWKTRTTNERPSNVAWQAQVIRLEVFLEESSPPILFVDLLESTKSPSAP